MEYAEKVKIDEQINAKVDQELKRREKVLQHYLQKNNIDFDKIEPQRGDHGVILILVGDSDP
ncbi:MAG: hypothetical protein ACRD8W_03660 [Nitrososphaeraceae archaeon]